jgi:hypothetical protein
MPVYQAEEIDANLRYTLVQGFSQLNLCLFTLILYRDRAGEEATYKKP